MTTAEEILARLNRGEDYELGKLVDKRADEWGMSRLATLRLLLKKED